MAWEFSSGLFKKL